MADEIQGVQDWSNICEMLGSPLGAFANDGSQITRVYDVPFHQDPNRSYLTIIREFLGGPFIDGGILKRNLPQNDLHKEDLYAIRADLLGGVQFWGQGAFPGLPAGAPVTSYNRMRIRVTFATLPYSVLPLTSLPPEAPERGRYVRKTTKGTGEFLTSQLGAWVFDDNNQQVSSRIAIWQRSSMITYEWFDVLPDGWNYPRALEMCGTTNDAQFDGYEAETLALLDASVEPHISAFGAPMEKVTFSMLYKPDGMNTAPKPGTGIHTKIRKRDDPGGDGPFQKTDFSDLFKP